MGIEPRALAHHLTANFYPFSLLSIERIKEAIWIIRLFELRAGESVTLRGSKSRDYIHILEGRVKITTDLEDESIVDERDTKNRPLFAPPEPYKFTIEASSSSLFSIADAAMFDALLLWDEFLAISPESTAAKMRPIKNSLAFSNLPLELWVDALSAMNLTRVEAGAVLCGSPPAEAPAGKMECRFPLGIMKSGLAVAARTDREGSETIVADVEPGHVFGSKAFVADALKGAAIRIVEPSELYELSAADYKRIARGSPVREIEAFNAREAIAEGARLLDIRYEMERAEASIPDSDHIELRQLREEIRRLDRSSKYIVYCRSGRRSRAAARIMSDAGLDALSLAGGIIGWPFDIIGDTY